MEHFDYWMLSEIDQTLQKEYDKLLRGNYGKILRAVAKDKSVFTEKIRNKKSEHCGKTRADALLAEWCNNRFHPLGKICLTRNRIQAIKDVYNEAVKPKKTG